MTKAAGPFNRPTNLAVAPSGDLIVSDGYGNARVLKFDRAPDGGQRPGDVSSGTDGHTPGQGLQRLLAQAGLDLGECRSERGCLLQGEVLWLWDEVVLAANCVLGKRGTTRAEDLVTRPELGHVRTNRLHYSRNIDSQQAAALGTPDAHEQPDEQRLAAHQMPVERID